MPDTKDIFITYASKDYKLAKKLYDYLTTRGLSCWMALVEAQKEAGEQYGLIIMQAIKKCKIMIVIFNKNANESRFVASEVERAFTYQKVIIPFKTDNAVPSDELEVFLAARQWLLAAEGKMDEHFNEVYLICARILEKGVRPPSPAKKVNRRRIVAAMSVIVVLVICGIFFLPKRSSCPENKIEFQNYIRQTQNDIISAALTLVEKDNVSFSPYYLSKKVERVRDSIIATRLETKKYRSLNRSCRESLKGQMTSYILKNSKPGIDSTISKLLMSRIMKLNKDDPNFELSVNSIEQQFRIATDVSLDYRQSDWERGIGLGKTLSIALPRFLRDKTIAELNKIEIAFVETNSSDSAHYITQLSFIKKL